MKSSLGHHAPSQDTGKLTSRGRIEARADVNFPLFYGRTSLHFTTAMGQEHTALYLLRGGANTGIKDVFGCTTYHIAALYNYHSIAEALKPYEGTYDSTSHV